MKKQKLKLAKLSLESFTTTIVKKQIDTIKGGSTDDDTTLHYSGYSCNITVQ